MVSPLEITGAILEDPLIASKPSKPVGKERRAF
jgi:hypothetical protein